MAIVLLLAVNVAKDPSYLSISYSAYNGALGGNVIDILWAAAPVMMIALALGISLWVWRWITRSPHGRWAQVSAGLLIGGALGNVIDRIRFGAVVDFLDFQRLGFFPWVFNVADSAITIGVVFLLLDSLRKESAA